MNFFRIFVTKNDNKRKLFSTTEKNLEIFPDTAEHAQEVE